MSIYNTCAQKVAILSFLFIISSCKSFIEVEAPITSSNADIVFSDDGMAASVMTGVYARMNNGFSSMGGTVITLSLFPELAADNFSVASTTSRLLPYYRNNLTPLYADLAGNYWTEFYPIIYICNAVIENGNKSNSLSEKVVKQLSGEAYFVRAFLYFYLVNMFGDVPLVTVTDYTISSTMARTEKSKVYAQIVLDLKKAIELLNNQYMDAALKKETLERVRPNKFAAMALLARVYLYIGDYGNAEIEAAAVIDNRALYDTVAINQVFLKNSKESIWSLQPVRTGENTQEAAYYVLPAAGPSGPRQVYLSPHLMNSFENGDARVTSWIQKRTATNGTVFPYVTKYKVNVINSPVTEYSVVMRLAEVYLIRAEARAQLDKFSDAQSDLNVIRKRAGLPKTTASSKTALVDAIAAERRVELFTEWGHRWFDLKRTGKINDVMKIITPIKGGTWKEESQLFPIPQVERGRNLSLTQNNGYPN